MVNASPETFNFTLPYPSKHLSDPLPLGALVSPSASSEEPGLVVVVPVSGKITYWESISSAATLDFLRQQRNGVEDSISGMFSGEHVTHLVNAESAGFILVFSSGRLAYMSVRDGQGRPGISVQFLRSNLGSVGGGLFGSIRHALKPSAVRGDIAAVRADPVSKVGERNVVAATAKGKLETWRVHRGGHHDAVAEVDAKDAIIRAVRDVEPSLNSFSDDSFEVLDFALVPKGVEAKYMNMTRLSEAMASQDDSVQHLLLLVSFASQRHSQYSLVEVIFSAQGLKIGMVRPIASYTTPASSSATEKPRLYLPKPALVAFLIFDHAVVLASLAMPPDSPEAQLQEDAHVYPASFEDVIDLRSEDTMEIVGSGVEDPIIAGQEHEVSRTHRYKTKNPTAVILVRGFGVVRVATTDVDRFGSERPPKVTAKSKLEQAVFYGLKDDNPLVFEGRRELQFSNKEIGDAALELSHEILSSSTPYLTGLPVAVGHNLRTRVTYLDRLMSHLNALKVDLDRQIRWALLANAEKMIVATGIWKQHEQFMADRPDNDKKSMVSEIVEYIHEDEKKNPNPAVGELDRVRHWFINDVWRLEIFIAWAYQMIKYVYKDHVLDDVAITRLIYEAVQINHGALHGALEYRQKKLPFYGLEGEDIEDGILVSGYDGLPEPWTATYFITNNVKRLVELCHQWLNQYYPPQLDTPASPDPGLIESIRGMLPNLTEHYLVALQEHSRWAAHSDDTKTVRWGEQCAKTYREDRYEKVVLLRQYGLWSQAIEVAKKNHCLLAMAELLVEEVRELRAAAANQELAVRTRDELRSKASAKEQQIGDYFEQYGDAFAFATYGIILEKDGIRTVLDFPADRKGYVTRFLRTRPELAKISWMNDVEKEKDIDHAAETLVDLGLRREQQVWNKKIELSLGKLALMAETEQQQQQQQQQQQPSSSSGGALAVPAEQARNRASLDKIDNELAVIRIQDKLYRWIYATISTALDASAELVLAMENHAGRIPKRQKALVQVFESAVARLLRHEALEPPALIDVLSLADLKHAISDGSVGVDEDQFFLALQVAECCLQGDERRQAQRLVWRRCFVADDWAHINGSTELQNDMETLEVVGVTAAYQTMFACYNGRTFPPSRPLLTHKLRSKMKLRC